MVTTLQKNCIPEISRVFSPYTVWTSEWSQPWSYLQRQWQTSAGMLQSQIPLKIVCSEHISMEIPLSLVCRQLFTFFDGTGTIRSPWQELGEEAILGFNTFWRAPSEMKDHPNILGHILSLVISRKEQWYFFVGQSTQNILKAFRLTLFCYFIHRNLEKIRPSHF